jgi:hypothetical protein
MSQFNISLPNNLTGTVKKGKITKMDFKVSDLLKFKKARPETRVAYRVKVDLAPGDMIIYQLSKTPEGKWLSTNTDAMMQAVILAIEKYETIRSDEMPERF